MRQFEPYTEEHVIPIVCFAILGVVGVWLGRRSSERRQTLIGVGLAVVTWSLMFGGSLIKMSQGTYTIQEDLPAYLCRLIAWFLPVVMLLRHRLWLGVLYFWILAGTLQGIVTPDLTEGFPSYFFFRYWMLHCGLVVTIIYAVMVFRLHITWKDFWRAILFAQVYLVLVHVLNMILGSNYSYTIHKPPGPSILDALGPWPLYILAGEVVMCALFVLLMLPFVFGQPHMAVRSVSSRP
jgi:hypothetical integral membrane protein (TIGR02206 family)